jgi:L-amino acid N-acyltransferase
MSLRAAEDTDLDAIAAIYNEVIANSTAIYAFEPFGVAAIGAMVEQRRAQRYPVLVVTKDDAFGGNQVIGFAWFGDWRGALPGYAYTIEHSVHVRKDARGAGVGRCLVSALIPIARALGKHVMIGAIDASNVGSLRFHERLGFERVAHFHQVGHKFARWLDLVFVQRLLDDATAPPR